MTSKQQQTQSPMPTESKVTPLGSHLKQHTRLNVFGPFVTKEGAENLRRYHYVGEDHSLVAGYMYYYWNQVIKLFPIRVSPNLITMLGLSFVVFGLLMFYAFTGRIIEVPTGSENPTQLPPALIALFAVLLFAYQTMDAVDGLQGKRVDMYNNPTTEIFDHFTDATVTCLSGIAGIGMLQLGKWQGLLTILSAWITFYCPTIEHLTTGKMIFRGGLSNPTEALLVVQLVTLFTAWYPTVWSRDIGSALGLMPVQLNSLVVAGGVIGAGIAIHSSMMSIYAHVKGDKQKFRAALQGFLPLAFVVVCAVAWLMLSPFKPISNAYRQFPVLTLATVACPWLYSIIRIIISEIQLIEFDVAGVLVGQLGLVIPVLAVHLFPISIAASIEVPAMILSLLISGTMLAYTVSQVVGQTCTALGMRHFYSIPKFERATKA